MIGSSGDLEERSDDTFGCRSPGKVLNNGFESVVPRDLKSLTGEFKSFQDIFKDSDHNLEREKEVPGFGK